MVGHQHHRPGRRQPVPVLQLDPPEEDVDQEPGQTLHPPIGQPTHGLMLGGLPPRGGRRVATIDGSAGTGSPNGPTQGDYGVSNTRPKAWRLSMYRWASAASDSGKARSITTRSSPWAMSPRWRAIMACGRGDISSSAPRK